MSATDVYQWMQEDYSILADARKVVENRHAVWTSYHDFCMSVAKWTTTPLVDGDNKPTLNIESIRQAVEDCTVKVFQLRKHNKVLCPCAMGNKLLSAG